MSVRGFVFIAMLLSVAVLVKPALKVAWSPPDSSASDEGTTVVQGTGQPEGAVAEDQTMVEPSDKTAEVQSEPEVRTAAENARRMGDRARSQMSDGGQQQSAAVETKSEDPVFNPQSLDSSNSQSDMAEITRSIVRDYAVRRERASLSPSVAAPAVPGDSDVARKAQFQAFDDARRASELMISEANGKLTAEQSRSSGLADQLSEAQSQLAAAQSTVAQLRDAVTSSDSRSDDWHRSVEQAKAEAADTRDELAKVTAEAAATKLALGKATSEVAEARQALDHAKTEAADAGAALAQARSEAADTAEQQTALDRAAASRAMQLQQQLDAERNRTADLGRELSGVRTELVELNDQQASDSDRRRALEASAKDLAAKLEIEQKKTAGLAAELADARATIRQLQDQVKAAQASAALPRTSQSAARGRKQERNTPEVQLPPVKPATPLVRLQPSTGTAAPVRDAKLTEGRDVKVTPGPDGTKAARAPAKRGRSGEVIGYIPVSPAQDEGFTSDDYSPYDTSDHTVFIDEYVGGPRTKAGVRRDIRVAKQSVLVR